MKAVRRNLAIFFLLIIPIIFVSCAVAPEEPPVESTTVDPNELVTDYVLSASDSADLAVLENYPNLKNLDLRGSTCYDTILDYIASHPHVTVTYDIKIGNRYFSPSVTEITLNEGEYTLDELMASLAYLPNVQTLCLPKTKLTAADLSALANTYPATAISYSIMLLNEEVSGDITELDLSTMAPEHLDAVCAALPSLLSLTDLHLSDAEGNSLLSIPDVKRVMDSVPGTVVHYTFSLFGKTVSTTDERIEYKNTRIGESGVEKLREALNILPEGTYLLLDQCGIENETLAQLRSDYPDKKVVWRVFYGNEGGSCFTDVTVFRSVGGLTNSTSKTLKYCTDIVYLDIGHCFSLSDLSFISYMPDLKVAIVVDCCTTSLEPFANCTNLEYLEIVNCNGVTDLSPLSNCVNLKGLNMSYVFSVKDLSPLYGLEKLERLYMGRNKFSPETIAEARAALPNCWVTDYAESVAWIGFNYSVGWRLDDEHTFAEWYQEIREIFGYTREIY